MTFDRTIPLTAALLAALAAPAFAESHVAESEGEMEAETAMMDADASTVVATVNGTEITLGHMIVMKQRLPQQYQQLPPNVLFDGVLDQLVQQTLLGQQVETMSMGSQLVLDNEERALRASEELTTAIEAAMTDEAVQAAYDEAFGSAEPENEYNASHILVETEEEAQALLAELEGGADFAELAKEKSTGPSGPRGGALDWFGIGQMVEPFQDAVVALEVGEISEPVQTQFGWHVILLNDTRLKEAPTLEMVESQLREQIQREAIEARVDELTEGSEISRVSVEEIDPALLDDLSLLGE